MGVADPAYIPVGTECAARGLRIKLGHARTPGTIRQHLRICNIALKVTVDPGWMEATQGCVASACRDQRRLLKQTNTCR